MSDEPTNPGAAPEETDASALSALKWLNEVGDPYTLAETIALRDEVTAGRVTLTDRERRALAVAGMVMLNAANEQAARLFVQQFAGAMSGAIMGLRRMIDDDMPKGKPS